MTYEDPYSSGRNDSGQFLDYSGGSSANFTNINEQINAGVGPYDSRLSAEQKLKNYRDTQFVHSDFSPTPYSDGAPGGVRARLPFGFRVKRFLWWMLCMGMIAAAYSIVIQVHSAYAPYVPPEHSFAEESSSPPSILQMQRDIYERRIRTFLKPDTPSNIIWRACRKSGCTSLSLAGLLALKPYALDSAVFTSQACDPYGLVGNVAGVQPRYEPETRLTECNLVNADEIRSAVKHEEDRQTRMTWIAIACAMVVILVVGGFTRPKLKAT
jgi:hypothetical protein